MEKNIKKLGENMNHVAEKTKDVLGIKTCPNCGAKLSKGANFCTACGRKNIKATFKEDNLKGGISHDRNRLQRINGRKPKICSGI